MTRRRAPRRPLIPPAGTRAPIGPDAVRAAYRAHKHDQHHGDVSTNCGTCARYLTGIARAAEHAAGERP